MKYLITESKLLDFIEQYVNRKFHPDYGWDTVEQYRWELEKYGYIDFRVNDFIGYSLISSEDGVLVLEISESVYEQLEDLFGEFWKKPFQEMVEKNTALFPDVFEKWPSRWNEEDHLP